MKRSGRAQASFYAAGLALSCGVAIHAWPQARQTASLDVPSLRIGQSSETLVIDGSLGDPFWRSFALPTAQSGQQGVPRDMAGDIRIGFRGRFLCFAARLPESGGKVLARSFGRNPEWERDALESPPVEDRMRYEIRFRARGGREEALTVEINPWGAYRVERNGELDAGAGLLAAALVDREGWSVEAALPLQSLNIAMDQPIGIRATRIRSRRPLAPEFRWSWPEAKSTGNVLAEIRDPEDAPEFRPPLLGNADPPLEVGRVPQPPPMPGYLNPSEPSWDDPAWRDVPTFSLPRNEPDPRRARYPTEVKWLQDGRTLSLLIRAVEPEPLVANAGGRDAAIESGDHLAIRLATDGASLLEILVNPVGAIRDWHGGGLRTLRRPATEWNADIKVQTHIGGSAWTVRLDLPLDPCARALGAPEIPRDWRVLLSRYRAPRAGEPAEVSALPPVGTSSFYGPIRYRRLRLTDKPPSQAATPESPQPPTGLAGELASLDSRVWPALDRSSRSVRTMVSAHQQKRAERAVLEERRAWDAIRTREDWERFRETRMPKLREAAGQIPSDRPPLDVRISATHTGDGYRLQNIVYQSRPGFYVSANLYLPARPQAPMPAIVIMHSFHYPKTQGELHDMGELWARTGSAVLIPERLGFGERVETTPWYRQAYASRSTFRKQLGLIADSFIGWMAWDLIRAVDLLSERPDIDRKRITMIGAVAGGNEPAAVAAALDERIAASIPYNYDHGRVRLDADFRGELTNQVNMSFVTAVVAPRRYVRASEFGWEGAAQPDFPGLWVDAWERSRKIWGLYGALDNLAHAQGYGLIRLSMERVSHCFSLGPQHREELYPLLRKWFDIPMPSTRDRAILPDSQLSVNPYREEARRQEAERRRPHADLVSMPPSLSAKLPRRQLYEVARDDARKSLIEARRKRSSLAPQRSREALRRGLAARLGDVQPNRTPRAVPFWTKTLSGARVEALALGVEDGIQVPVLFLRPAKTGQTPVVVAIAKSGKDRFLNSRPAQIEKLLREGIAVCLPDLRGTGETAPEPDWFNQGSGMTETELALGGTMLGARLKDLRTVVAYLRTRPDVDRKRIGLWGDGFAPANSNTLFVDELESEAGPQIQHHSEPMGALLALLAALYEDDLPIVAAQRGLAAYLSALDSAFLYAPADALVHGVLQAGDIADIAAALAPRRLLIEGAVNGRNVRLSAGELDAALELAAKAYERAGAKDRLHVGDTPQDPAQWLADGLKRN